MNEEKYINRKMTRLAAALFYPGAGFGFFGVLFQAAPLALVSLILLVPALILDIRFSRCPYCGAGYRGFYWYAPSAGYCQRCGKKLVFDNYAPKDRKDDPHD